MVKDITLRKKTEQKIKYLAFHDELTGLANRRLLFDRIEEMRKNVQVFSLMLIDFDHFKRIHDLYGHEFGDKVLQVIANRLNHIFPESCTKTRLGGDEFALLIPANDVQGEQLVCSILDCSLMRWLSSYGRKRWRKLGLLKRLFFFQPCSVVWR